MSTDTPTPEKRYEWQVFCPICKASNCNNNITCIKCDAPLEPTNKPEALSWEQTLKQVAESPEHKPWCVGLGEFMDENAWLRLVISEAATLFGESCFNRGAREQREIIKAEAEIPEHEFDFSTIEKIRYILRNAPAPQFKP